MIPDLERAVVLAFYVPVIVVMILETLAPKRLPRRSTARRWLAISGLALINSFAGRLAIATSSLLAAIEAESRNFGLLHLFPLPGAITFLLSVLLLDLSGYFKHRAYHAVPLLWSLHVVHHTDADMDVATGLRHHPADYLLDGLMTTCIVFALGVPVESLLVTQALALAHNSFRHGNFTIPGALERWLRPFLITPDVHRVHHSALERETNSNYGVLFPWWDRMFGSYVAAPSRTHTEMELGLEYFRAPEEDGLLRMLTQPVRQPAARAANRLSPSRTQGSS